MKSLTLACASLVACASLTIPKAIGDSSGSWGVIYVLDGSNSMWGQVDGEAKIEVAKTVLSDLVEEASAGGQVGLVAYGHREKDSCEDIELLVPLGRDPVAIRNAVQNVTPMGKTPISAALNLAAESWNNTDAGRNIVLISDGVETCNADPCATAATLARNAINTRIHVVGFDVNDEEKRALECIAEAGRGQYFQASGAASFKLAMAEVTKVAQQESNDAPRPDSKQVFLDDFEGNELADHWQISNPDPDSFVVEDGSLLSINNAVGGLSEKDGRNIFTLSQDMPSGDFDATIRFRAELSTGEDRVDFGLRKDDQNSIFVRLWASDGSGTCSDIAITLHKLSRGEDTYFTTPIRGKLGCSGPSPQQYEAVKSTIQELGATITLSKRGRKYQAALQISGEEADDGTPISYTTDSLSSLRSPGALSFAIGKNRSNAPGEILLFFDSVEVIEFAAD